MKKITIIICIFCAFVGKIFAQAPQQFNYQAIARNSVGQGIPNANIKARISILDGSATAATVYSETRNVTTNQLGLFTIAIGSAGAASTTGVFTSIDWSTGKKFIKVEVDPLGGNNLAVLGNTELLSVPYALYAVNGRVGPTGPQGVHGNTGATGATGAQGPQGLTGATGAQGPIGLTGATGATGAAGTNGTNGKNTLILTTPEAAGANCAAGGVKQEYGLDANNNGTLETGEINAALTKYVCNGTAGAAANAWGLTGNTGNAASNFLGTTDAQPINIKTGGVDRGKIDEKGNLLFTGPTAPLPTVPANPPASGAGTRMMWYADKAAFRVGLVNDNYWDKDSIGVGSFATGENTKAKGIISTAMGTSTIASGNVSTALGFVTNASGSTSTAMGSGSSASGDISTAMGAVTKASGLLSTAMGYSTTASGNYSTSMGYETKASGAVSTAMGYSTKASGNYSTAMGVATFSKGESSTTMGEGTVAKAYGSTSIGNYNDTTDFPNYYVSAPSDRIFQIGNGGLVSPSNAMTVLKNGNVGIGVLAPTNKLEVNGALKITDGTQGANKILTSDANGVGTWQTPAPAWGLTGNAGTTPGTNFIGTSDDKDVLLKRWGHKAGLLSLTNTSFGDSASISNEDPVPGSNALYNTAIGAKALSKNQFTGNNTAIGYKTLYSSTTGYANTAVGSFALSSNTTGTFNTSLGVSALSSNTTGESNTASGFASLYLNTIGFYNTAYGSGSLYNNTVGNYNTAIGKDALGLNTIGANNTATGYQALLSNVDGFHNTATGHASLYKNTNGSFNTANGQYTLYNNSTGSENVATGNYALYNNTTANSNTATGYTALYSNTTGTQNVANGKDAMRLNTTGFLNTAIGFNAMKNNTTGNYNTALGDNSLITVTTGSNNTGLGDNAQVPSATGDNQVRIGNVFVGYVGAQVALSVTSDKRWKSDIQKSALGLDFIKTLNPVSYYRNNDKAKKTEYGFIAQELEASLNKANATNNGIITKDDDGMYSVRYNDLLAPMVKAIQEQQAMIEAQQKQLETQQKQIDELKVLLKK